jgi:hypothetical protein
LRRELPASKPSDFQNKNTLPPERYEQQREVPEMKAGDEIQAAPDVELHMEDESLVIHDDLTITATSSVELMRDARRWLGVSQSGSKKGLFDRCKKAKETVLRRSLVESAHVQSKSLQKEVESIPVPAQPTDRDRPFLS